MVFTLLVVCHSILTGSIVVRQNEILDADPEGAADIPECAFDDSDQRSSGQLEALWQAVVEIYHEAAECEEYNQDENAWGSGVIQRILELGTKHQPILHVKNMSVLTNQDSITHRINRSADKHRLSTPFS